MSQSIASRPRRQQTEPDDVVLARALHAAEWARKNIVIVTIVVVALVLLVGGFLWYRANAARADEQAAIDFLPVEQAVLSGEESTSLQQLQSFIQRHGDTEYGDEARLLLAQLHLRNGRPQDAIGAAQPVASEMNASPVGVQGALLLAAAQEAAGDTAAAISTYRNVGETAEADFRREEGLVGAALLLEASGDLDGAASIYQQLVEMKQDTPDEAFYQMRLTELEARETAE